MRDSTAAKQNGVFKAVISTGAAFKLKVVVLGVSDVERAKAFYEKPGWLGKWRDVVSVDEVQWQEQGRDVTATADALSLASWTSLVPT